jgi:lipopolysaccharide export system protein LptA
MNMKKTFFLCCLAFGLVSPLLRAERADREKPIAVEADRVTVDDVKRVQTLEGNVVLTQGTLTLRSDRIVITEDQYGFQHGTALGGPDGLARFRQKRDNSEEWIEGEGEEIQYNTRTEVAELFRRAWIRNGADELRGNYIWYDSIAERYMAAAGKTPEEGRRDKATGGEGAPPRVTIILQPKKQENAPEAPVSPPFSTPKLPETH